MTREIWELNPDYDQRAIFEKAAQNLLKLDAEGSRIVKVIAQAMMDYDNWNPIDPTPEADFGRAEGSEQYTAFHVVYDALSDHQLAPTIAALADAWQKHQAALQADEAADNAPLSALGAGRGNAPQKSSLLCPQRTPRNPPIRSNEAT